ncbi:hypothetical protein ACFPM7_14345 [Actinokineospora guangxiensis]|uniref:Excreted virulence factor EspC (Type VII ESX diderm) n=1 Tax=Actinokineospora guangxiensis TaxID=1490288 RepID=A0ABW0ELF8_9PSEU
MSTPDLPRTALADVIFHRVHFPVQRPADRPLVGTRLAVALDRALVDLAAPGAGAELAAGLAWTAALGETCLLARAVADVRAGVDALRDGDLGGAAKALESARADLPTP